MQHEHKLAEQTVGYGSLCGHMQVCGCMCVCVCSCVCVLLVNLKIAWRKIEQTKTQELL